MFTSLIAALAVAPSAGAQAPSANEVTIYNQGFALVKELRRLSLKEGRQTVAIEDVAAQIEPDSVGFHSISDKDSFDVLEQNYQYDLISPIAILNKAVGQRIRFIRVLPNSSKEVLTGTLLSSPTSVVNPGTGGESSGSYQTYNGMVIKTDDGRIVLNPTGEVEVDTIPEGLISKPTLLWDIESRKAGDNSVELSYLTQGMNWNATYVLTMDDLKMTGDLMGWVTLSNQSGATYKNTQLKLLAGQVNRPEERPMGIAGGRMQMKAAAPQFQEQTLFEYHLYTLQRPTTLHDKETKQVSLLEGHGVPLTKKLIVDATMNMGRYYPSEGEVGTGNISPQVRIEFVNSKENGLGMPLPEGNVKVYQRDTSGSVQMLGEDHIGHTPRDERISLVLGRSFDVVAERKRTDFHRISDRSFSETFEITIRNHKDIPAEVTVIERHYGQWQISHNSDPFTKLDSDTMQFEVNVPQNASKKITYTVVTSW